MRGLGSRSVRAEFAELICADDQWLRSEFDALIAANFGVPPAPPRPAPPRTPPARPSRRHPPWLVFPAPGPDPHAMADRRSAIRRQRSPPATVPVRP